MPPRITFIRRLRAHNVASRTTAASRAFSSTPPSHASTATQRKRQRDPYAVAQAKAKKAANLSRQEVLKQERAGTLGNPVRGITTPFVESFDAGFVVAEEHSLEKPKRPLVSGAVLPDKVKPAENKRRGYEKSHPQLEPSPSFASTENRIAASPVKHAPGPFRDELEHLNFFLSKKELDRTIKRSKWLAQPLSDDSGRREKEDGQDHSTARSGDREDSVTQNVAVEAEPNSRHAVSQQGLDAGSSEKISELLQSATSQNFAERPDYGLAFDQLSEFTSDSTPEMRNKKLREGHDTAEEALRRISSLSLGSSKDRLRVNIQRCIAEFGRHKTDLELPPKPLAAGASSPSETFPRVGADTGSSEVQIAILTAKIRTLADFLESRGTPSDKMNKRNLRLLVHRRAKLLKYLRKKERGGPRWQHLVEKLGLTDATWKGEISL